MTRFRRLALRLLVPEKGAVWKNAPEVTPNSSKTK